ncbi:MAG TPA: ATP synthase F1 subunit epsilon [Actinomycetota bacterium]
MAKPLRVAVVSPEREVYAGTARMVVAKGVAGDVGILPDHAPMLVELAIHAVRVIVEEGREDVILVDGGFLNVTPSEDETRVDVLAEHAELASEIDATAAAARAEELKRRLEDEEDASLRAELARAMMRAEHGRG